MVNAGFRYRADKGMRVVLPDESDEDESEEFERKSRARTGPSPALVCVASFRSKYLAPEAIAVLKAMDADTAKETCINILKSLGYVVSLRTASQSKRDRSKEIAKRSEKRAIARALKSAIAASEAKEQPASDQSAALA